MMSHINNYILKQLLTLFGFFALVLVLIYWINRAVRLFDELIANGQSAIVFLEFTSLTLPWMISIITPAAGFAAAVYVINRLSSDGELVILKNSGQSTQAISLPVWVFALLMATMNLVLSNILVPISQHQLHGRQLEVAENLTARLLTEGKFLTPSDGITFYLKEMNSDGQLGSVFLNDTSNPRTNLTYTASKAFLVRAENGPRLVLIDGLIQSFDNETKQLTVTKFNDFVINIGELISPNVTKTKNITHYTSLEISKELLLGKIHQSVSIHEALFTLNLRISSPLLGIFAVLLAYAALSSGTFSRFGLWRQILVAVFWLISLKFIEGLCIDYVRHVENSIWVLYLPLLFGFFVFQSVIFTVDRPWLKTQGPLL
jgi:lipopolysaccharide export system permease protein